MNLLSYHPPHFTNRTFFIPSSFNNPNSFLYNGHAFYSDPNHYRFFRNEQRFPRPLFIKPQPCLKMNMCRYRAACLYLPYCAFSHSEEEREFYVPGVRISPHSEMVVRFFQAQLAISHIVNVRLNVTASLFPPTTLRRGNSNCVVTWNIGIVIMTPVYTRIVRRSSDLLCYVIPNITIGLRTTKIYFMHRNFSSHDLIDTFDFCHIIFTSQ